MSGRAWEAWQLRSSSVVCTYCSSRNIHCITFSLISDCKWFPYMTFSLISLFSVFFYYKTHLHCMKCSLIGSNSDNSEHFMQWIISWSTVFGRLFIYFNIFIQDEKFSKAVFQLGPVWWLYTIHSIQLMTNLKEIDHTH